MCLYEEAVGIPLLVRPPGGGRAQVVHEIVNQLDVTATVRDYLGLTDDGASAAQTLRATIEGCPNPGLTGRALPIVYNGNRGISFRQRALVSSERKLILTEGDRDELYALEADPLEKRNLVDDPVWRRTVDKERRSLREVLVNRRVGETELEAFGL
jgi:choline-sulfatase